MIKAVIIDDEPYCCETLEILIGHHCRELTVSAICFSGKEGLEAIRQHHPQLVFLDIEMPHMNGFDMLEQLPVIDFGLVFTTSYDQYAIRAIRFSALDYLLKPIDREELQRAVQKAAAKLQAPLPLQMKILLEKLHHPAAPMLKIALPTMEGLQMVPVDTIISCASDSNYTVLSLKNKQKIIISRTLKEMEEMLEDHSFLRVHHSYMVNLNEIGKYVKGEGGYLVMTDDSTIDVSRSRKEMLLKKLLPKRS
jgi:two-component system LytT family response regulator